MSLRKFWYYLRKYTKHNTFCFGPSGPTIRTEHGCLCPIEFIGSRVLNNHISLNITGEMIGMTMYDVVSVMHAADCPIGWLSKERQKIRKKLFEVLQLNKKVLNKEMKEST